MRDLMYQPKGSMCMSCIHTERDCSFLDFSKMPILVSMKDIAIVKCTEFEAKQKVVAGVKA